MFNDGSKWYSSSWGHRLTGAAIQGVGHAAGAEGGPAGGGFFAQAFLHATGGDGFEPQGEVFFEGRLPQQGPALGLCHRSEW